MKYKFNLSYSPTVATVLPIRTTRVCFPQHNDDLAVSIDRADGEWYYTRSLEGNLIFVGGDYRWIMALPFDGTFTLNIKESHDGGATYYDYFTGTFSRASLEIDEDNRTATLNGLKEGVEDLIKNGKNEDYDLMKLIPDADAKEVQGQIHPALAMVDYRSERISQSDVFCGSAMTSGGYKEESGWNENTRFDAGIDLAYWMFAGVYVEAKVEMQSGYTSGDGTYFGRLNYHVLDGFTTPTGTLYRQDGTKSLELSVDKHTQQNSDIYTLYCKCSVAPDKLALAVEVVGSGTSFVKSYASFERSGGNYKKVSLVYHYIRASLLTGLNDFGVAELAKLNIGKYYKSATAFNGQGLNIAITANTVEEPNGHRLVPGTGEQGTVPQYFAPPDSTAHWIPLAEDNWKYVSMWYTIEPSVANGLADPAKFGSFRWTRCWTIGTCIKYLLNRITDGKVVFSESTDYSQFLYGNPNPVEGHEPFQWLVTQKSNVMRPAAGGASRCIVRLEWFLELLRNAFNCYYWFEKRNDGRYNFRIEHVEYFRRGGAYTPNTQDDPPLDLTRLKPRRNFLRNGQPAKRYADQTNRYTFDLDGMVEKYTYSWQGDGGSDDFKGNPMYFRAGWIEKGSSDDRQVDNIFADLGWLMLNAGTATESSKNYDGLFAFSGYFPQTIATPWKENSHPSNQTIILGTHNSIVYCDIWLTIPIGQTVRVLLIGDGSQDEVTSCVGTGEPQLISLHEIVAYNPPRVLVLDYGVNYSQVTLHRIHSIYPYQVYSVPNTLNLLSESENPSYLQNGPMAWPWLQNEYLHYDIPAKKWTYKKDEYTDNPDLVWESDGTIKMVKKQNLAVVPVPDASTEDAIMGIMGVKTGLGTGIIDNAKINLSSRNAEMTIIYDINPQNN